MKFSRGVRLFSVAILIGSMSVPALQSVVAATPVPTCNAQHFTTTSSTTSRPGGSTVRLVLTSGYFPTCRWASATTYQFASSSGVAVGSKVSLASTKGLAVPQQPWLVDDTFQLIQNVLTEEGVVCTQKQASFVKVTSPGGGRLLVRLGRTLGVCVNGTTKWTSLSSLTFPRPVTCTSADLRLSVGESDGTAGTIYYPLVVENVGSHACVLSGTPSVQPTTGSLAGVAHILVGPRATNRTIAGSGDGDPIRLSPGAKASAPFGVVETGNFTPSQCVAMKFESLSVGIASVSGGASWWVPLSSTTCTHLASTNISGFVPGVTGYVAS